VTRERILCQYALHARMLSIKNLPQVHSGSKAMKMRVAVDKLNIKT
jgi:hypothetical protein